MTSTVQLDLKGLNCPLPVLRANKKMKELMSGDVLEIEVTDPAAPKDFETYCEITGNPLLACEAGDGVFTLRLQKA